LGCMKAIEAKNRGFQESTWRRWGGNRKARRPVLGRELCLPKTGPAWEWNNYGGEGVRETGGSVIDPKAFTGGGDQRNMKKGFPECFQRQCPPAEGVGGRGETQKKAMELAGTGRN